MKTALAHSDRLRYNTTVNVPAARMVAERPALVIRCCGRPTGPDSNAWLHASPKIGPQVSSNPRFFTRIDSSSRLADKVSAAVLQKVSVFIFTFFEMGISTGTSNDQKKIPSAENVRGVNQVIDPCNIKVLVVHVFIVALKDRVEDLQCFYKTAINIWAYAGLKLQ